MRQDVGGDGLHEGGVKPKLLTHVRARARARARSASRVAQWVPPPAGWIYELVIGSRLGRAASPRTAALALGGP